LRIFGSFCKKVLGVFCEFLKVFLWICISFFTVLERFLMVVLQVFWEFVEGFMGGRGGGGFVVFFKDFLCCYHPIIYRILSISSHLLESSSHLAESSNQLAEI
jgi:hypothetical protein